MILKLYSRRVNSFSVQKLLHIPSHLLNIVIIIIIIIIIVVIILIVVIVIVTVISITVFVMLKS